MSGPRNSGRFAFKYLRPADLRRLEHLLFAPRRVVEGRYAGHYLTRQRGQSVEFRDYREYLPGDDIGNVDWKVYGRSDKLFIKIFEHHSELVVHLLVDGSASMGYRGMESQTPRSASKYDYACSLAASIAFVILKQHDHFGLAVAQEGLRHQLAPQGSMRHLVDSLHLLERVRPRGRAGLAEALHALNRQGSRRNLLVIFSDLWDDPDATARALAARVHLGGEIVVFHTLHPDELHLPDIEHGLFVDSETRSEIRLDVSEVRDLYASSVREYVEMWSRRCRALGIDYVRVPTSRPYYQTLEQCVAGRAAKRG